MTEQIYKIIEEINKKIGTVPTDAHGYYSQGNHMIVIGLSMAKDIVIRIAKEAEHGETA